MGRVHVSKGWHLGTNCDWECAHAAAGDGALVEVRECARELRADPDALRVTHGLALTRCVREGRVCVRTGSFSYDKDGMLALEKGVFALDTGFCWLIRRACLRYRRAYLRFRDSGFVVFFGGRVCVT